MSDTIRKITNISMCVHTNDKQFYPGETKVLYQFSSLNPVVSKQIKRTGEFGPCEISCRSDFRFCSFEHTWTLPPYTRGNRGSPCGVMVKVNDCRIVVSKFELQSRYYVHFWTNTLRKGKTSPYPPSYGLNSTSTVLLEGWIWY